MLVGSDRDAVEVHGYLLSGGHALLGRRGFERLREAQVEKELP